MPYGVWTCENGRRVYFNRWYRALLVIMPDGTKLRGKPSEFVQGIKETVWFYNDGTKDKVAAGIAAYEAATGRPWDWEAARREYRQIDLRSVCTIWSEVGRNAAIEFKSMRGKSMSEMNEEAQIAAGRRIADAIERVMRQAQAKYKFPTAVVAGGAIEASLRLCIEEMGALAASEWLNRCADDLVKHELVVLQSDTTQGKTSKLN